MIPGFLANNVSSVSIIISNHFVIPYVLCNLHNIPKQQILVPKQFAIYKEKLHHCTQTNCNTEQESDLKISDIL